MSRYPVQYLSKSKGMVDIEVMHDMHLLNAYRSVGRDAVDAGATSSRLLECLAEELASRGLDPSYPNGKPPTPPVDEEGL